VVASIVDFNWLSQMVGFANNCAHFELTLSADTYPFGLLIGVPEITIDEARP
jgi:hypothetical protein